MLIRLPGTGSFCVFANQMATANELLHTMDPDRFAEIIGASPRSFREELFRAAGVKAKSGAFRVKSASKSALKAKKLHASMKSGFEINDEVSEELIRNYLFTRRDLLSSALTALGVEHDQGLTDQDLDAVVENLEPAKTKELQQELSAAHQAADVELYMKFMNFPGIEDQ